MATEDQSLAVFRSPLVLGRAAASFLQLSACPAHALLKWPGCHFGGVLLDSC